MQIFSRDVVVMVTLIRCYGADENYTIFHPRVVVIAFIWVSVYSVSNSLLKGILTLTCFKIITRHMW